MPTEPQVMVVGAGPTGLLLAAELARRGVTCLLIDEEDAPRGWDRATVIHPRSLEIFEAIGVIDRLLAAGVRVRGARFRSDGQTLGELHLGSEASSYGFDIGISEETTESVLIDYLREQGGSVTRSTRLVGLRPGPDGVVAEIKRSGDTSEVSVAWIVGCDGFRSSVRNLAGIDLLGTQVESPWAVFDAATEGWGEEYDLTFAHLDLPTVILTPLPGRRWRVYLRPEAESSDLVADATEVVRRYDPSVTFADVENPVRFRCHSGVASRFKAGHVLLAGDAAHVCSPTEGHGMNTGLQDAFNLGWKLALICRGLSGPGLLESYDAERRPVALRIAQSGEDSEAAQSIHSAEERLARDSGIRSTFADPESSHPEIVAHAELDRSYAGCGIVLGDTNDLLSPGVRLPNTAPVHPFGGDELPLHRLTHRTNHTLLVLGGADADAEEVLEFKRVLDTSLAGSAMVDAVLGFSVQPATADLGQIDRAVAEQLGIERLTVLAIRPDRYVGLRRDAGDPVIVERYLEGLER